MHRSHYAAKLSHFEELASRAAYQAATSINAADREAWDERAARYDVRADEYRAAFAKAA